MSSECNFQFNMELMNNPSYCKFYGHYMLIRVFNIHGAPQ